MNTTHDPRRGAPSASGMPRYHACDAAFQMELKAREQNLVPDGLAGADSGQRIHGELHIPGSQELALSEADMAERCEDQRQTVVSEWQADHYSRDGIEYQLFKETRLGMTALGTVITVTPETKARVVFSGQLDGGEIDVGSDGILWDFKTLLGEHETAQSNLQLLSLAVLAAKRWSLDSVRVALIQPWRGQPTAADFDKEALRAAAEFIQMELRLITAENSIEATTPGKHCHFCPGRLVCPAVSAHAFTATECIAPHTLPPDNKTAKSAIWARAHEFDGEDLAALLRDPRLKYALWLLEAAKDVARQRLEKDPASVPGFELVDVEGKRKIMEPLTAWAALGDHLVNGEGGAARSFMRACNPSPARLTEELRKASGRKLNKDGSLHKTQFTLTELAAKDFLTTKIGHLITRKISKRVKAVGETLELENETDE